MNQIFKGEKCKYQLTLIILLCTNVFGSESLKLSIVSNGTDYLYETVELVCKVNDSSVSSISWLRNDTELLVKKFSNETYHEAIHVIKNISLDDFDLYTCNVISKSGEIYNESKHVTFNVPREILIQDVYTGKSGHHVPLQCLVKGFPAPSLYKVEWTFRNIVLKNSSNHQIINVRKNLGEIYSNLLIENLTQVDNGTYKCVVYDESAETQLVVKSKPSVKLVLVKPVGKDKIYCNWTIFDGNAVVQKITLQYLEVNKKITRNETIKPPKSHILLTKLKQDAKYKFSVFAKNEMGLAKDEWEDYVTTLPEDPHFIPEVLFKGSTSNTVTLAWNSQPNITEFFNFYNVVVMTAQGGIRNYTTFENPSMIDKLTPGTDYRFQIQACSSYTESCEGLSNIVNGTTMDGMSSAPRNLTVQCHFDQRTHDSVVHVHWQDPEHPRGIIQVFVVALMGNASYYDEHGRQAEDEIGPIKKTIIADNGIPRETKFVRQPPNTRIYISVCAKTRTRICGIPAESSCSTLESIPGTEELSKAYWRAVQHKETQQILFRVTLPHISQRNGSICCLRVIVVRLPKDKTVEDLQPPYEILLQSYESVHNGSNYGAYVAELLDASSRNILIGDGVLNDTRMCHRCWKPDELVGMGISYRPSEQYPSFDTDDFYRHRKRHANPNGPQSSKSSFLMPHDGPLDPESTYTAYIDAIVINERNQRLMSQSKYFHPLRPIRVETPESVVPGVAIIGSLIVALIVVLIALMCVMRWRRKEPGDQEYGLTHSIQQWCRRLRGQQPIPSEEPPNLPPISKGDLVEAYISRHKDSDLGFQQEFEKLPDRFCDRTSHASDLRENSGKNRYPDIKAYDQTRVRLSVSENSTDYINANVVVGYKERKKFICAQGPMEATVVDWWKMIWEQHVQFILMLTNVEEYNKTKCAKYWPNEGSTDYGDFVVTHSLEKRYSDYLVRNLKLSKTKPNSSDDGNREEREILQYHYLVWKDFMAPEHPVGILRFIKRCNEVYAPDKGPILVHCSAGVGRTGTLVALDSLLQQLNEENCVSIFNTICDLRHQRNYLVQSLKQYIFIYRALMEMAQFGDTEIHVSELKHQIDKLKVVPEGKQNSRMQDEFERLAQVIEDRKPFTVGASEENRHRNRHENIIPYDRSRVHLSPMPSLSKEINTYINASFIEGYDNTEQFIIAQDPLDVTIGDFWRMVVEQNIRSIVMLSETGEDKCPRYWPEKDQETSHDYIKVKYMQSQSFPFYYRREFTVTDTKSDHSCLVTQFQYNGWPVGEGEVPQIDRGIVELIDTTFKYRDTLDGNVGPMIVHCSDGADRSCIFVALAILAQQMLTESRVDVFSAVRKLRSQRQGLFRNFAQYEFIYRGLYTYAELHVANGNASH